MECKAKNTKGVENCKQIKNKQQHVDSIVNSYILPENFKKSEELGIKSINSAKKCYESIKGDCIASETINLYPYCPYCEKISKKY